MIMYCAGEHDGATIINVPPGAPPFCCDDCASDDAQCACGAADFSAPHVGALPPSPPLARNS